MFGSLRLLSDELVRVSSVRRSGKHAGKKRDNIYARCLCTKCGREYNACKDNLVNGLVTQCKLCNVKQGHETQMKKLWGGIVPDELDRHIKRRWDAIKSRTEDPTHTSYARYGGRGIRLSAEFQNPLVFVAYVKSLPNASKALQIDRIDNNRGYERGNIRWVTGRVNCNNREITEKVVYNGIEMPISYFIAEHTHLCNTYVRNLIREGKTPEEIVAISNAAPSVDERARGWRRGTIIVEFAGERLSLMEFARRHVKHMVYQNVLKLYRRGKTLDEIIKWKKRSDIITYNGVDLHFKDFVRQHTRISYVYARKLYRDGKSLDEIAQWGR